MAGTVDFVALEPFTSTAPDRAPGRNRHRRGPRTVRHRPQGRLSGTAVPRRYAPVETEVAATAAKLAAHTSARHDFELSTTFCGVRSGGKYTSYHHRFVFGSVSDNLAETLGTKGSPISLSTACASGATAHPARHRSDPPRRDRRSAVRRRPTARSIRKRWCASPALGAVDPERSAAGRVKAILEEP